MTSSRGAKGFGQHERGAVAVEFALIAPILFTLVFGIVQFGAYFFQVQGTAAAAREGARQAAVGKTCVEVRQVTEDRSPAGPDTVVDVVYPSPLKVGGDVKVTARVQAIDLQLPFIPFPIGATITQDGVARLEVVPTNTNSCIE